MARKHRFEACTSDMRSQKVLLGLLAIANKEVGPGTWLGFSVQLHEEQATCPEDRRRLLA